MTSTTPETATVEVTQAEYLIRKNGYWYRPKAQGYTIVEAEAGRFTLDEAIQYSHPNGPDGPRDGISYELAPAAQDRTRATRQDGLREAWDRIAQDVCGVVAEIPDRSSPDDQPDMMLVTADELHLIVTLALENEAERAALSDSSTREESGANGNAGDALREAGWLSDLRRWAYPNEQDRREIAALKKAARVITQMHAEKVWCSGDVADTLAMIRAALSASPEGEGK